MNRPLGGRIEFHNNQMSLLMSVFQNGSSGRESLSAGTDNRNFILFIYHQFRSRSLSW